jgi:hypothetical protein
MANKKPQVYFGAMPNGKKEGDDEVRKDVHIIYGQAHFWILGPIFTFWSHRVPNNK